MNKQEEKQEESFEELINNKFHELIDKEQLLRPNDLIVYNERKILELFFNDGITLGLKIARQIATDERNKIDLTLK